MNIVAINALAGLLENIPSRFEQGFNMSSYLATQGDEAFDEDHTNVGHHCGTTACIAGWASSFLQRDGTLLNEARTHAQMALMHSDGIGHPSWNTHAGLAAGLLGLDSEEAERLFEPMNTDFERDDIEWSEVSPRQAAKVLRHLAKTGEVDWNVGLAA